MKTTSTARIVVGLLICIVAVVLVDQFFNVDDNEDDGDEPVQASPAQQAAIDELRAVLPVDFKTNQSGQVTLLATSGAELTDAFVAQLAKLPDLADVQLKGCTLGAEGIGAIASLPRLESLRLEEAQLAPDSLGPLAQATTLRQLFLSDSTINDQSLETIGQLSELELLDLSRTEITDEGLQTLRRLNSLQRLYLADTSVSGEGLSTFPDSHALSLLNLSGCPLTPEGIQELRRFPELKTLYLDRVQFDDALISHVMDVTTQSNTQLQGLFISETPLTDSAIEPLKALASLPNLSLVGLNNAGISKAAFQDLAETTPDTRYLVDYNPGED